MNFSELFIRRPVMTSLVMLGLLGFGLFAFFQLPISDLPNVDFPTIQVAASLPGASPETIAAAVATPLERQFSTIAGIDSITSTSALGISNITIVFNLNRNIDAAAQDVQAAIAAAARLLPTEMPNPPSYKKVNPADAPILFLAISSASLRLSDVHEYADTLLAQRISTVQGVAQVSIFGPQKYAVRTQVDPLKLAAHDLGIDEVSKAIQNANVNLPTGTLSGPHQAVTIQSTGQLFNANDYRQLIVAYRHGSPIRLHQIARVIDDVENDKIASWFGNTRGIVLAIQKQPGANTIAVVDSIKSLLPNFRTQLPPAVHLDILSDKSLTIRASVHDVQSTLVLAVILVVLVIFLFLRNLPATLIPSLAMPLSLIGTFIVMQLLGLSVDNFSLLAMTLATGFVVDDAIVVLENIVRHIELGLSPLNAALVGSREITFTIVSMTISLVAVFIPVLFMGGILGRLLNEFAIVIGVAILISGFISLTLTPMLCSLFLSPHQNKKPSRLYSLTEKGFDSLLHLYLASLHFALRHRRLVLFSAFSTIATTAYLFSLLPKGFIPNEDTGQIFITTEAAQGVSFTKMAELQQSVAKVILGKPYVDGFMSSIGVGPSTTTGNAGRLFINLKPQGQRPSAAQIIDQLRPELAAVPGLRCFPQIVPTIRIGGSLTKSLYQFTLSGPDLELLYQTAPQVEARLRQIPGLIDVTSDLQITNPQVLVKIQRDRAAALGISANQIESALANAYSSQQVSTIYTATNQYRVILEVLPSFQSNPQDLDSLYLRSSTGSLVPLSAVTQSQPSLGPLTVQHLGQLPAVTISFNLTNGSSLGDAIPKINAAVQPDIPQGITTSFQGAAQAFQASLAGIGLLLLMAVLVIYLVLGILYESFIHPITILSGLPSAGFGALLALLLFKMELNVYGFVGILMLIGIVKKNAIILIDFALNSQRLHSQSPENAILEACRIRFRPITMTTMAALIGALPIAIGFGNSSESRRPLGVAIIGGLLVSQFLTLYFTPVIYIYLENLKKSSPVNPPPNLAHIPLPTPIS
ncbi:MAG: efflux RND transporter permease subunit [Verrucomicrobiota bacterium]